MSFNDIYRLRVWARLHGQAVCNVLHFKEVTALPGSGAAVLCADFNTNLGTAWKARNASSSGPLMEFLECQRIVPYGDVPHIHLWTGGTTGTATGTSYSGTVAECVTLYTGQAGRRKRGRIYFAGGVGNDMAQGQWTSAQTTRTAALMTALLARYGEPAAPSQFMLGVWSRVIAGPDPPFNSDGFAPVISSTVRTTVRNQRRRQIGVGR